MVTYPDRQLPHGRPAEDLIIVRNILAERNVSLKPPKAEAPPEKPAAPLDINRTDFTKEELEEIFTNKWYSKDQNLQILIRNHWGNKRVLGIILINLEPYTVMRRYVEDRVTYFDTCFFPNCPYKRIPWRYTYGDKMNNENERP
jgi:hypothetical protein